MTQSTNTHLEPHQKAAQSDRHLALIAEMGRRFSSSLDIEETLKRGLDLVTRYLDAQAASIFILTGGVGPLICRACVGPVDIVGLEVPPDKGIIGRAVSKRKSSLVRDVSSDPDFTSTTDQKTGFVTRSILCAPLQVGDECLGAVQLLNKTGGSGLFNQHDLHLLEALSTSAALAIKNARQARELIEQETVRRELNLAADIQRGLLPVSLKHGCPVHGINVPAHVVSGDFYDICPMSDGRIWFSLGDVAGKGMNAALLMAKTASLFRCLAKTSYSPGRLLGRINTELCETDSLGLFVTMVGGYFDPVTGELCFANAGHEPPLSLDHSTGVFTEYEAEAPPLGIADDIVPDTGYPETRIKLDCGSFYIFTDGLTEGRLNNKELGEKGVRNLITELAKHPAEERPQRTVDFMTNENIKIHDDMTFLVVQHQPDTIGKHGCGKDCICATTAKRKEGENLLFLRLPAKPVNLRIIRNAVENAITACQQCDQWAHDVVLATDEACQNIIRHAYKCEQIEHSDGMDIEVSVYRMSDRLHIHIRDFATAVDASCLEPLTKDKLEPGGLGTMLMHEVMDSCNLTHPPGGKGNLLELVKLFKTPVKDT